MGVNATGKPQPVIASFEDRRFSGRWNVPLRTYQGDVLFVSESSALSLYCPLNVILSILGMSQTPFFLLCPIFLSHALSVRFKKFSSR